jgi:hypothetical protein
MTPEQQDAQETLQAAVEKQMIAYAEEDDSVRVTGDWVLVACVQSIDLDSGERKYSYHMSFSGGEQPEHVAYGLLGLGRDLLKEGSVGG